MPIHNRYNLNNIRAGIKNPRLIRDEIDRITEKTEIKLNNIVGQRLFRFKHGNGINIVEQDWDNLIILDACRFDAFKSFNTIQGELNYVISRGSHSREFCLKNFSGKDLRDTIYVTANPYSIVVCNDEFFKIKTSFEKDSEVFIDDLQYNIVRSTNKKNLKAKQHRTIDPNKLKHLAISMNKKHPNKKIIVHFMQPHEPYLGKKAKKLRKRIRENHSIQFSYWQVDEKTANEDCLHSLLEAANRRYINKSEIIDIYNENLEIVLEDVEELINSLDGKSIVTSDHGEMLGDGLISNMYGHPEGFFCEELRKVPWLEIESKSRRKILKGDTTENSSISDSEIEEQLESLGYI